MTHTPTAHKSEGELVRQYLPLALRIARRIRTRDPESAESDACLALLLCVRSWRPERGTKLGTWLHGNLYRKMIDLLRVRTGRRGSRRQRLLSRCVSLSRAPRASGNLRDPGSLCPDSGLAAEDTRRLLLSGESERCQRILRLYLSGVTQAEIGRREGVSESWVSQTITRIKERCQWPDKAPALLRELEGGAP